MFICIKKFTVIDHNTFSLLNTGMTGIMELHLNNPTNLDGLRCFRVPLTSASEIGAKNKRSDMTEKGFSLGHSVLTMDLKL
jgi:hypothetical protein